MAGSAAVVTKKAGVLGDGQEVQIISVAWTADDTDGTVPATSLGRVVGVLERIVTDPGATAPTANYDITVTDEDEVDVLGGAGANRSAASTEEAALPIGTYFLRSVANDLEFNLAGNSVNSATGIFRMYVRKAW